MALKIIDLEKTMDDLDDLLAEVDFQAQCDSPYIVKYLGKDINSKGFLFFNKRNRTLLKKIKNKDGYGLNVVFDFFLFNTFLVTN